jgi:TPP-dependent trihydroxycyclohexane-1,2-dione (THcHDO) dehydratase
MESLSVRVRNPFALREALQVALEVTWPDLPSEQVASLRSFTRVIPAQVGPAALSVGGDVQVGVLSCAGHFRQSRTWYWLREDLCQAFTELEKDLAK